MIQKTIARFFIVKLFCLFFCFTSAVNIYGQDDYQQRIDSLLKTIPSLSGEQKLRAMVNLSRMPFDDDQVEETTFKYNADLRKEARKQGNIKILCIAMIDEMFNYYNYNRIELFEQKIEEYLQFFIKNQQQSYY
jgi:hypothetical protein